MKINNRFIRFVIVGIFNTINYYLMFLILLLLININYLYAHIIAFIYSVLVSFFLTSIWTFKVRPTFKSFLLFPITVLPNFLLSTIGTYIGVSLLGFNEKVFSLVMMILVVPITYLLNKFIFIKKSKL